MFKLFLNQNDVAYGVNKSLDGYRPTSLIDKY